MAEQKGIIKIQGTLDGITFFKRKDQYFARTQGGVDKSRIMNDPKFQRTRENLTEFAAVAHANKTLRDANGVLIRKAYDGTLNNRLFSLFSKVKNMDVVSPRGKRQVYEGLATPEGRDLMRGFNFNGRSHLNTVLAAPYALDTATGVVTITDLVPADMLDAPPHATHVDFRAGFLNVNFETGAYAITYSPVLNMKLDMTMSTPVLTPTGVPAGTGTALYVLLVEFLQQVNGVQYALNNGNFNALGLLDVV